MKTATGTTVIHNGQLIDGTGAAPVPDAALVVADGRVAYAGPAAQAPTPPPDAERSRGSPGRPCSRSGGSAARHLRPRHGRSTSARASYPRSRRWR